MNYRTKIAREYKPHGTHDKVSVRHVRINSQGYDTHGNYWGVGQKLYCAEGEITRVFVRASDRKHAIAQLRVTYPELTFFRE